MSFMSQKCIEQLTQQGVIRLLPLVVQWIAGREFKRVKGTPADVAAYDAAAQTAFSDAIENPTSIITFSGGAATDAFTNAVNEFFNITARCPGWNEATCSFDWGEFACFCAAAVPMDPALIVELGKTQPADQPVAYTCDPKVKADPVYKTASTGGGGVPLVISTDKDTGYGWKTWAVGGAVAVGLGVAGYMVFGKKHPSHSGDASNPARSTINNSDREQWIDNDEGLYSWWRSSRMSKREFIKANKVEIDAAIRSVLDAPPREKTWRDYAGNPSHHHYTLAELEAMPTLEHGHFDNLKIKTPTTQVWLSRMTKADGAAYNNAVTVEHMRNGLWETVDEYQAR